MKRRFALLFVTCALAATKAESAEIVRLNSKNFGAYAPAGKEADAIYGDYVLRNDKLVCVVADPVPTRNANMTVRNVGGCVIDLTSRRQPNDQLGCYYPGAGRSLLRFHQASAAGKASGTATVEPLVELAEKGSEVRLEVRAAAEKGKPELRVVYTLRDGWEYVQVETQYVNTDHVPLDVELVDAVRADRTFERSAAGDPSFWLYDKWFRQGYGLLIDEFSTQAGTPAVRPGAPRFGLLLAFRHPQQAPEGEVTLPPGRSFTLRRRLLAADDLFALRALPRRQAGEKLVTVRVCVEDAALETIAEVDVTALAGAELKQPYGHGHTGADGTLHFAVPPGRYRLEVSHQARETKTIDIDTAKSTDYTVTLADPGYVVGKITSKDGGPIPCKVQFIGQEDTKDPDFFVDSGDTAVKNLVYSHNGKFEQQIPPGKYRVVISYGPEYDAVFTDIEVERGKKTPLAARLIRTVDTTGWISADFHNHSSPSGDNTSSQFGRVQNILCEQIEFAPCTEHNRIDTYVPHLKRLGVEHLLATCSGIELTGQPLPLNHQNAFPLVFKPHLQDGGGPTTDEDPEVQIERLALWDGKSEKLVQQNHPDIGWLFFDRDGDGKPDGGFKKSIPFIDAMEVHPLDGLLRQPIVEIQDASKQRRLENNRIFNWLQLLNQGRRITGVVNTDSHYNFHESGYWRNYLKSPTDDPAKIETLDMVHAAERGHVIMTTAPFLEVKLTADGATGAAAKSSGTAGDDVAASSGRARLHIRVQCANWYDIDRVQVYLNGRPAKELNFSRYTTPERFARGGGKSAVKSAVKFDQTVPLEFKQDTHVIVMAVGERSTLGVVQGPRWGRIEPIAVSNPIYVDVDGGGFKPNGDTLGSPLPVKGGLPVKKKAEPSEKAEPKEPEKKDKSKPAG
jgi:hypothetical protein